MISVLVPTYRRPALLDACLASIGQQTRRDFEVIVRHDGPTDQYAPVWTHPERMGWGTTPRHAGLAATINACFRAARGSYVAVSADDDLMDARKLEVLGDYLDTHPDCDVVYSLPYVTNSHGERQHTPERNVAWLRKYPVVTAATLARGDGLLIHGTATLYRRVAWERAGPWDETLQSAEEWEYHFRLLCEAHAVFHGVAAVTTGYRQHGGQKSLVHRRRSPQRVRALETIYTRYAAWLPRRADGVANRN